MIGFYKSTHLNQERARKASSDERLSISSALMVWVLLAGLGWLGIIAMIGAATS